MKISLESKNLKRKAILIVECPMHSDEEQLGNGKILFATKCDFANTANRSYVFWTWEKTILGKLITGLKEQRIIKPLTLKNLVY